MTDIARETSSSPALNPALVAMLVGRHNNNSDTMDEQARLVTRLNPDFMRRLIDNLSMVPVSSDPREAFLAGVVFMGAAVQVQKSINDLESQFTLEPAVPDVIAAQPPMMAV